MSPDNYLLIYCHSNPGSFTHAVLENVMAGLRLNQKSVAVIDLYQEQFNPVLLVDATHRRRDIIHDPETARYRQLITDYDNHVFIYPVWWGGFPAILKGFIDRSFASGLTYTFKGKSENSILPEGLMKSKKAYFVYTLDTPLLFALLDPGWLSLKWSVFKYCGYRQVKRVYLPGLKRKSVAQRQQWLLKVSRYFSKL